MAEIQLQQLLWKMKVEEKGKGESCTARDESEWDTAQLRIKVTGTRAAGQAPWHRAEIYGKVSAALRNN